jgi:hypothetical protein
MEFGLVMRYGGDEQPGRPPDGVLDGVKVEARDDVVPDDPVVEEDDGDLDLKLAVLDIYNERYDRRMESKALLFDRALTDYKRVRPLADHHSTIIDRSHRCTRARGRGRRRSATSSSGSSRLRGFRRRPTTRPSSTACSVRRHAEPFIGKC